MTASDAPAAVVAADEGFWIGAEPGQRVWVQLVGEGESPVKVDPGSRLSFTGRLVAHGPGFAAAVGVEPDEGGDELDRAGAHVEVAATEVAAAP